MDPASRRTFLKQALSVTATVATANVAVYAIGAAFKELDGSMVAGAKTWTDTGDQIWCATALFAASGSPCSSPGAVRRGKGLNAFWCRKLVCQ